MTRTSKLNPWIPFWLAFDDYYEYVELPLIWRNAQREYGITRESLFNARLNGRTYGFGEKHKGQKLIKHFDDNGMRL